MISSRSMSISRQCISVCLTGTYPSSLRKDIVEDQAMGGQGLEEIKNELPGAIHLRAAWRWHWAATYRTRDLPIGVYPRLGNVRLSGFVQNAQQKAAAEESARHFPGREPTRNDASRLVRGFGGQGDDLIPGKSIRPAQ